MSQSLWFADFEVFRHDWLFAARRQSDGKSVAVWNDPESVRDFVDLMNPVLVGYNIRDYDSQILKAVLLDWSPEDIHNLSQTICENDDRTVAWALFQGHPWIDLPPVIDLFHDIVGERGEAQRIGLKNIQANISLPIVESSVSFDIDRPLTSAQRDEVERYCLHDVDATAALYDLRFDYLKAKSDLCEYAGIDPLTMLKHTNARIVSEVLHAARLEHPHDPEDRYVVPDNVDRTAIPADVLAFVERFHGYNCEGDSGTVEFSFHGCPTVVGVGGIHAAVPSYRERQSDERVILLQDIGSYYPSLILQNGYMSRAVADASLYQRFYDMRMKAKAEGDKATAEAAKLVLNTTFGTMKDSYNKMYDPMMNTRVCLSGQLYILDLIEQMFRAVGDDLTLIQLNTDGWIISCDANCRLLLESIVAEWSERTHFTVDTHEVETIVQANVNNYVLRTSEGQVKVKGGVVARYYGGDFKSNSATIIDKAVVDYLLDGKSIDSTIESCDDITRFQIVAKAGRTFQKVVHQTGVVRPCEHEYKRGVCTKCGINRKQVEYECKEVLVQRVNRVYATTDSSYGGIFKLKIEEGKEVGRSKIPLTPEHCWIDNENRWVDTPIELTTLDREWYVALAKRKAREFITRSKEEREQMADTEETTNELQQTEAKAPAPRSRKAKDIAEAAPTPLSFWQKLLQLQIAMSEASTGVTFDKTVQAGSATVEYADTQQYKMWLASKCTGIGLVFGLDIHEAIFHGVITPESKTPEYAVSVHGEVVLTDADTGEYARYGVSGFGQTVRAGFCEGIAQTNLLRNFLLNNFLLDNKGREGDDQLANSGEIPGKGYVSQGEKGAIKDGITAAKAEERKYPSDLYAKALHDKVVEAHAVDDTFGARFLAKHYDADSGALLLGEDGKPILDKVTATRWYSKAEEIIASGAAS